MNKFTEIPIKFPNDFLRYRGSIKGGLSIYFIHGYKTVPPAKNELQNPKDPMVIIEWSQAVRRAKSFNGSELSGK